MKLQDTIINSLLNGGFLETDGNTYWWIDAEKYTVIKKPMFLNLIQKKIVYAKRIDDDTTCYYVNDELREELYKKLSKHKTAEINIPNQAQSPKSENKSRNDEKINKIKDFLHL